MVSVKRIDDLTILNDTFPFSSVFVTIFYNSHPLPSGDMVLKCPFTQFNLSSILD